MMVILAHGVEIHRPQLILGLKHEDCCHWGAGVYWIIIGSGT